MCYGPRWPGDNTCQQDTVVSGCLGMLLFGALLAPALLCLWDWLTR